MYWHIKLDGENIIGHVHSSHPDFTPADYDETVSADKLVNDDGDYKYKYSGGQLVELDPAEIDAHPIKVEKDAEGKFANVYDLILKRLALLEVKNHQLTPQNIKDRADAKLTVVNQKLMDFLGV